MGKEPVMNAGAQSLRSVNLNKEPLPRSHGAGDWLCLARPGKVLGHIPTRYRPGRPSYSFCDKFFHQALKNTNNACQRQVPDTDNNQQGNCLEIA